MLALTISGLARATDAQAASAAIEGLTQAYTLRASLNYSYGWSSSRVAAVETVAITNNGAGIDALNLDFVPRFLDPRAGYNYRISAVTVDGSPAAWRWSTVTNLAVSLGRTVETGESVTLGIRFVIQVGTSTDVWGSRLSKGAGMLALGNWFPVVSTAHRTGAIGEWQVSSAGTYDVDVTLADSVYRSLGVHAVVGSGKLVDRRTNESGGTVGWVFHAENVRNFVLSVMPSHAWCSAATGNEAGTVIGVQARSSTNCRAMLSHAKRAFATYSAAFGAYPYATYTVAQAPTPWAWMEYPSLIFIGRQMITADGIWHETAHQWFYGILGNNQASEPWIDEALAYFASHHFRGVSIGRLYGSTLDVNSPVSRFSRWDGYNQYDDVVYRRGALMLDRMRARMGTAAFLKTLREYIEEHRFTVVDGADFFAYLNTAAGGGFCGYVSYC